MGTPAFDLDKFTVESVASVGAAGKEFTKPANARSFMVYALEAYWLNGGDTAAPYTVSAIADGATVRAPFAAATWSPALPCAALATVLITAQSGSLTNVAIIWMF